MQIIRIACTIACLGLAFEAHAAKMCEKYATACKAEKTIKQLPMDDNKLAVIHNCIIEAARADGENGAACLHEQSGHQHE
jgi:hypothetical protein